tara:strand:- start:14702 stop:15679 length:978 start_codon:yes stop_codon:yes gene_type:complete
MKILVIQSRMGIGDMVIFLPFIEAISRKFNSTVSIMVKENSKASEFLSENECIDEILYLQRDKTKNSRHNGLIGTINLIKDIKKKKFDNIFIFNSSLRFNLIAKLVGAKKVYQYPLFKKKGQHIIKAAQSFLKENLDISIESNPQIKIKEEKIEEVKNKYNINNKNKNINLLLGIGGSGPNKRIPAEIYIKFLNNCKKEYDLRVFLATGKNEEEQKILNQIIEKKNNFNFVRLDDLSIKEILPIIKCCDVAVCNDTSFSHFSAALGIQTIVLMADTSTLYGNYSPQMHPIIPDQINIDQLSLAKERIDPEKIFIVFKKILTKLNF